MAENDIVRTFHEDGYALLQGYIDVEVVERLRASALANFAECLEIIRNRQLHFGIGIKNGFVEIVQRHENRYEMPFNMGSNFDELLTPKIIEICQMILKSDEYDIINKSLIVSTPGAKDQGWHVDGPHISISEYKPSHCFNVFIPLIDITKEHGPTEFRPRSQMYTRDMKKHFLQALLLKKMKPVDAPLLQRGSALIFDYRVLHRGTANTTSELRPFVVFTFAKKGFRDVLNFPRRSILDETATEEPVHDEASCESSAH